MTKGVDGGVLFMKCRFVLPRWGLGFVCVCTVLAYSSVCVPQTRSSRRSDTKCLANNRRSQVTYSTTSHVPHYIFSQRAVSYCNICCLESREKDILHVDNQQNNSSAPDTNTCILSDSLLTGETDIEQDIRTRNEAHKQTNGLV